MQRSAGRHNRAADPCRPPHPRAAAPGGVGAAAAGSVYDWLNEDKRNAVEIIVEERAAARDPEDKDGNLPDLAGRGRVTRR